MDYQDAYQKEIERRLVIQSDEIDNLRIVSNQHHDELINVKYKMYFIITLEIIAILMALPQFINYIPSLIRLLI